MARRWVTLLALLWSLLGVTTTVNAAALTYDAEPIERVDVHDFRGAQASLTQFTNAVRSLPRFPYRLEFVFDEPVTERRVIMMNIDRVIDQNRVVEVPVRPRLSKRPVVGLLREVQYPTRDRDRHTISGKIGHERVHQPFGSVDSRAAK